MEEWFAHAWQYHAALAAVACMLAFIAIRAERIRLRRKNLDSVGFMPWTLIYLTNFLAAIVMLGLAARKWLVS